MSKQRNQMALRAEAEEIRDLSPGPMLFPDEDPATYEALRQALFADLAPSTAYERVLARNIVTLEWEAIRHRRIRHSLIRAKIRDLATGVFANGSFDGALFADEEHTHLGRALVSMDPDRVAEAMAALEERKVSVDEILAEAYCRVSGMVELHERKLAEIEVRRRRLREDYDRLKAARAKPVEDAEIVA